jgi:hypothetical protein
MEAYAGVRTKKADFGYHLVSSVFGRTALPERFIKNEPFFSPAKALVEEL